MAMTWEIKIWGSVVLTDLLTFNTLLTARLLYVTHQNIGVHF